jgi:hypothetical protein
MPETLQKLLDDLLKACAQGAGYEDAACALKAEIASVEDGLVATRDGQRWQVSAKPA